MITANNITLAHLIILAGFAHVIIGNGFGFAVHASDLHGDGFTHPVFAVKGTKAFFTHTDGTRTKGNIASKVTDPADVEAIRIAVKALFSADTRGSRSCVSANAI